MAEGPLQDHAARRDLAAGGHLVRQSVPLPSVPAAGARAAPALKPRSPFPNHPPSLLPAQHPTALLRRTAPHCAAQVLILSYETFRIHSALLTKPGTCDLLICDEAHRLKNDETLTNRARPAPLTPHLAAPCPRGSVPGPPHLAHAQAPAAHSSAAPPSAGAGRPRVQAPHPPLRHTHPEQAGALHPCAALAPPLRRPMRLSLTLPLPGRCVLPAPHRTSSTPW